MAYTKYKLSSLEALNDGFLSEGFLLT